MNCSMPGHPVHHQLLELAQTYVHQVCDAIQLSHPLLSPFFLPSIFPSIQVFSSESVLCIRWPKDWCFSFSISPSNEYSGLISFRISLQFKGLSRVFSNTTGVECMKKQARGYRVLNGRQGGPTSPSWGNSVLSVHWKDCCWSWNSNTLATWYEELTHLKRPWS